VISARHRGDIKPDCPAPGQRTDLRTHLKSSSDGEPYFISRLLFKLEEAKAILREESSSLRAGRKHSHRRGSSTCRIGRDVPAGFSIRALAPGTCHERVRLVNPASKGRIAPRIQALLVVHLLDIHTRTGLFRADKGTVRMAPD